MPALRKCSPEELKHILTLAGWKVYNEDNYNWSLVKGIGTESLEIPKKGKIVSFDVQEHCLAIADLAPGDYFELLNSVRKQEST